MQSSNLLTLIAIAFALSAYVSTVRIRVIDKRMKVYASLLMFGDAPLILSGLTLIGYIGLRRYFGIDWTGLRETGFLFFGFGMLVLTAFHANEWCKSINELYKRINNWFKSRNNTKN